MFSKWLIMVNKITANIVKPTGARMNRKKYFYFNVSEEPLQNSKKTDGSLI